MKRFLHTALAFLSLFCATAHAQTPAQAPAEPALPALSLLRGDYVDAPAGYTITRPKSFARNFLFYPDESGRIYWTPTVRQINGVRTIVRFPATRYEVRDYAGNVVKTGAPTWTPTTWLQGAGNDTCSIELGQMPLGWYDLTLWDDAMPLAQRVYPAYNVSNYTAFAVVRRDARFPERPANRTNVAGATGEGGEAPAIGGNAMDVFHRAMTGFGPERYNFSAFSTPAALFAEQDLNVSLDKQFYLPYSDPARPRALFASFTNKQFPNGATLAASALPLTQIAGHYASDVNLFEGENEPQGRQILGDVSYQGVGGPAYLPRMKLLRDAIRAGNPNAKLMGPSSVSLAPDSLPWIKQLLAAQLPSGERGSDIIDTFSFHIYNGVNGDKVLAERTMADFKAAVLDPYPKYFGNSYQTEQGYPAAMRGTYFPAHQARWAFMQRMVFETVGIPASHDHYWGGFSGFPEWAFNSDGSPNPIVPQYRVYTGEVWGKAFERKISFGQNDDDLLIGNLFVSTSDATRVAVVMSAGDTQNVLQVQTNVAPTSVHDVFGNDVSYAFADGICTIPVRERIYVQLPANAVFLPFVDSRPDLLRNQVVTATFGGTSTTTTKITDGVLRAALGAGGNRVTGLNAPWQQVLTDIPGAPVPGPVTLDVPLSQDNSLKSIDRVQLFATPPHQPQTSLLDWDLQYQDANGAWVLIQHFHEDTKVKLRYRFSNKSAAVTNYSERSIWDVRFPAVAARALRVVANDATVGGMPTPETALLTGGMASDGVKRVVIRSIRAFESGAVARPAMPDPATFNVAMQEATRRIVVSKYNSPNAPVNVEIPATIGDVRGSFVVTFRVQATPTPTPAPTP